MVIAKVLPTGLTLAAVLALSNIGVAILERRSDHFLAGSRVGDIYSRMTEVFDRRGIVDRFIAESSKT